MQTITLPKKIEFIKGDKANSGSIIVESCYPGYGTTLGNSLRRVLLSSLPGAAVIGVKIKNAGHEFTTIPHVKEDVLEIILNLKQLRLKVYTDEVVKLELDVHGEKEVKASDITKNSQVEIVNPNLSLACITDMAGSLNMEIYVSTGRGYETIESRENKKREIGYIEMDSLFSPVSAVSVSVESMRVGKMTNWDKLILDITTDGIISPEEAFNQAVVILIEQFNGLISAGAKEFEADTEAKDEVAADEEIKAKEAKAKKAEKEPEEESIDKKSKRGRPKKS